MHRTLAAWLTTPLVTLVTSMPAFSVHAADPFPTRPVRILVGYVPGGGADEAARLVAPGLSAALGQSVVIENRPGANGMIANEQLTRSPADGYTLTMVTSSHSINPLAYPKLPYDTLKDFATVSEVASAPLIMVVPASSPVGSVREFIEHAKKAQAQNVPLKYASAGVGNITQLAAELFGSMTGVKMIHVPYKGSGAALIDLLAGQVDVYFTPTPSALPHVQSGKLKALAVTSRARSASAPHVPTLSETGVTGYEAASWYGLVAPAATPPTVLKIIHDAVARSLAAPELKAAMQNKGLDPIGSTPQQFDAKIRMELDKWKKVFSEANIKME